MVITGGVLVPNPRTCAPTKPSVQSGFRTRRAFLIAHGVDKTNGSDKIQYSVAETQPNFLGQTIVSRARAIYRGGYGQPACYAVYQ